MTDSSLVVCADNVDGRPLLDLPLLEEYDQVDQQLGHPADHGASGVLGGFSVTEFGFLNF